MPLIVETGAGLANSNSYISIAEANTYFADRGMTEWENLDDADDKAPALIRAADYMRRTYGRLWAGYRTGSAQRMDWPRQGVPAPQAYDYAGGGYYVYNVVPEEIKFAQAEIAYLIAQGISLDPNLEPPVIEETIGPITTKWAAGARQTTVFTAVQNALSSFLVNRNTFPIYRG